MTDLLLFISEDHAVGLSTFTIMAGLGGSFGYMMGGFDWGSLGNINLSPYFGISH